MSDLVPEPDFQTIFDSLPGIYLVLKPDFTMVAANEARLKATMTTREGSLGKNLFDLFPDNPDDPAATGVANLKASLQRVLQTKQADTMAVQKYDIPKERGGFEARYWSPMNSPVLDEKGEVAYIVHRVVDVTDFIRLKQEGAEQSKLTEELKAQVQKTETEIYLRAQEIQEANQKLLELDRLKTDFFANVSHELRTPLTLILAPLEALLSDKALSENPPALGMVQTVHNNAVRLLQMINGLLDFSKVSAGKTEVHREAVNILDLTRSLFWDFRPVMDQKKIQADISADAPKPFVEMDRYLYERILFNLLSNAVKFTPAGGKVTLRLEAGDGKLTLSVSDTGIGISAKDQERLFQKFHQVEGSATRRFEGTGLGLALVKEFGQLLGGDIRLSSEPGKGSTFTLTCQAPEAKTPLELLEDSAPARRPPAAAVPAGLTPIAKTNDENTDLPKILVAEDNPELRAFIAALLSPFCRVKTADDGVEALDLARRWKPDLVLSDVMMPGMSGFQLVQEMKKNRETSSIPLVLLTAMTSRESMMKGWEAGADDYLFKPFHPKELEARVKSILSGLEWRRKSEAYRRQRDALEHFTHIASHDLREPLRKIVTFVELFQGSQKDLDQESENYLRAISGAAMRMSRLLDSLIEYSRSGQEGGAFTKSPLDKILVQVLAGLEGDIQAAKAEITADPLPELEVHPSQIASVFNNLIGNALKYRREDRPPQIKIEAKRLEFEWLFTVTDNGIGFEPNQSDKIFLMFERLHGLGKYPGEGMGLAICRRIIEFYGGRIWADSKPGQGSTFSFTLLAEREKAGSSKKD